ncbi:hypothetical protein [Cryobacterium arcticum]|uniref:Uncharacterized protein n=1 Tax=Cryobacterium arcticum TaxID=670052 RepID=A0A317ZNJ9_9MICO|nr:hypothetical protein [Cryobacterium arcticum]PXA67478.1 hypothetical protein CTB96_12190 [Cryobacterium arcticum]
MTADIRPGRTCSICSHEERMVIESLILASRSYRSLSKRFQVSEDSLGRHVRNHLSGEIKAAMQSSSIARTTDILQRLADIAEDANTARKRALERGATLLAIRAGEAETRALMVLLERLQVDDLSVLSLLRAGETLARSVGQATRDNPTVGKAIAHRLRASGEGQDADVLEELADRLIRETTNALGETL